MEMHCTAYLRTSVPVTPHAAPMEPHVASMWDPWVPRWSLRAHGPPGAWADQDDLGPVYAYTAMRHSLLYPPAELLVTRKC